MTYRSICKEATESKYRACIRAVLPTLKRIISELVDRR
jgi:hypothetical protein